MPSSATNSTSPPSPPSPPAGPPLGTWASRRHATMPVPPSPAFVWRITSSTNDDTSRSESERCGGTNDVVRRPPSGERGCEDGLGRGGDLFGHDRDALL